IALASSGVISNREGESRENFLKLALANNELTFNHDRRLAYGSSENGFSRRSAYPQLSACSFMEPEELRQVLGYERADLPSDFAHNTFNRYLRDVLQRGDSSDEYVLNVANAVLVDKRVELLEEYGRNVQYLYRAAVRDVDFSREAPRIVEEINDYIRKNTNGKTNQLFDELSPSIILVLLNAVYFKGTWKTRFELERTRDEIFYYNGLESEER
ncbi:Corticosteroid-binding globulin, partial [Araneus ventricosus]